MLMRRSRTRRLRAFVPLLATLAVVGPLQLEQAARASLDRGGFDAMRL